MKKWTVIHTEASTGWGGQEIRILTESSAMQKKGHHVIIVTQEESCLLEKAKKANLETATISFQKKDTLKTFLKLNELLHKYKPDFVNTHSSKDSWIGGLATRAFGSKTKIIRTRHLSTPVSKNIINSFIYENIPHKVVTTGEAIRTQLIKNNKMNPKKIVSIPTGINSKFFSSKNIKKDVREELQLSKNTLLVGMVSVLRSWKGHQYFIEACEFLLNILPQVKFLIVGSGPCYDVIKKNIVEKRLQNNILLLGYREDIPHILASLNVLVHPSYANEGIPQTLLQAMAMKTPIIASHLEPIKEVIKDGETGLLAPPKNSQVLAQKIAFLIENHHLKQNLTEQAYKLFLEKYTLDEMIKKTENLYTELDLR
ncbi:MAG: glycosyltransferase family 4 protein [Deltaproteobacteria bacterium]|nr:glycosyltransferase family 4 protein [Deltaproteobacteria bacterium]